MKITYTIKEVKKEIKALTYERMQNAQAQKESLEQCLEIKSTSNWQDLCRSKNQILNQ